MGRERKYPGWRLPFLGLLAAGIVALPAAGAGAPASKVSPGVLAHLSQAVGLRYWASQPAAAPAPLQARLAALKKVGKHKAGKGAKSKAYNFDDLGLPQNEESIAACRTNTKYVLGGTNDYRGLLDPDGDFTGWHFSTDGGASLANEGLLPKLTISGVDVPSGGDPVDVADDGCNLYAGSLN